MAGLYPVAHNRNEAVKIKRDMVIIWKEITIKK